MLTKKDRAELRAELLEDFLKVFATKQELQEVQRELKEDILHFKLEILGELRAIREALSS